MLQGSDHTYLNRTPYVTDNMCVHMQKCRRMQRCEDFYHHPWARTTSEAPHLEGRSEMKRPTTADVDYL